MATDSSNRVTIGKAASPCLLRCFDRVLFIIAGKDDINRSLVEFEIRPDLTTDHGVSCPSAPEISP